MNKNRNRRGGRNNAKPQGELQEVLEAGTSRDKQHNGFKRDNKRGNKNYRSDRQNYMGNRFLIDHKDLLSEPDATIKIQADRFSGIKADEMDKVKEDLMETFEDSVFEFYGSREYGLGFRIDIMVKPCKNFLAQLYICY